MALPLIIGKDYCFPSLSLLSKYWQDPSGKRVCVYVARCVQQLISSVLQRDPSFQALLPGSPNKTSQPWWIIGKPSVRQYADLRRMAR